MIVPRHAMTAKTGFFKQMGDKKAENAKGNGVPGDSKVAGGS
jgi:hypothetical protein